ncbi:MAG: helix-turn-helix transcriptional regulator [Pseudobdellovibrionaceae bacterium]
MSQKERGIIAVILLAIAIMVGVDLMTDSREGVMGWHMLIEALMGAAALLGVFYIIRGSLELKHRLEKEIHDFSQFRKEADAWRIESRKYIEGLSFAIDQQLTKWKLSSAEKEVAFLLLKGLSLKEIAVIRGTTEKTARVQSMAIYSKAGLAGRSELAAFFLEDLLVPTNV